MRFYTKSLLIAITGIALLLSIPSCLRVAWEWLEDTSYYAPGYTEAKFNSIREGMLEAEVIRVLGKPLKVMKATECTEWIYGPSNLGVSDDGGLYVSSSDPANYTIVMADGMGTITSVRGTYLKYNGQALAGRPLAEMESRFGKPRKVIRQPAQKYLVYSGSKVDGSYQIRNVGLDAADRVSCIVARFYQD
jgi:hypothetical protein